MGRLGGKYTALEPYAAWLTNGHTNIKPDWVLGPTLLGKEIGWRPPFGRPGDPEVKAFAVKLFKTAQRLLDDGLLRVHPLRHMSGGLEGVLDGMDLLKRKMISGEKLVYRLD